MLCVQMAFKYLSWLLYPLFGCYAVYSLLYVEHKGWYSWVLSMLYGFLLTFGKLANVWVDSTTYRFAFRALFVSTFCGMWSKCLYEKKAMFSYLHDGYISNFQ